MEAIAAVCTTTADPLRSELFDTHAPTPHEAVLVAAAVADELNIEIESLKLWGEGNLRGGGRLVSALTGPCLSHQETSHMAKHIRRGKTLSTPILKISEKS